ncbi:GNAT family N-acetyltransferase [Roseibium sp. SCPC15]|uniref:GNAT family N-acetyltransferase n=1 Tax=Roseibium sp. SCP15 TaxID=3141376 RepID=UPI003335B9DD
MTRPDTPSVSCSDFNQLTPHDVHDLLKLRQDVFVLEQAALYPDIDGKDPVARHLFIRETASGDLIGAIRLFVAPDQGIARIGRVVIARSARGSGLGRILMQAGIDKAEELLPGCAIHLGAQAYLEKFYKSLEFTTVSEVYVEDGIPHIDMVRAGSEAH